MIVERKQAVVEDTKLPFDADIVTGEAVEVRENGLIGAFVQRKNLEGVGLEFVEAEHAEVMHSHAVHNQAFVGSLRLVEFAQAATDLGKGGPLRWLEAVQEYLVGGGEAVLDGVQAGPLLACYGLGAGLVVKARGGRVKDGEKGSGHGGRNTVFVFNSMGVIYNVF
ncbi:hypothetical protein HZB60_02690 [candidate division KSB1 bacterium]|nr:hypothetical protein [candidate division KSB1 bacterium]